MSEEDVEKGTRWESELDKQLSESNFGILCLTPESSKALYIHYEAGALSKTVNESHVCPYLIGIEPTDIIGPLAKFQAARANREDTLKLIKTINSAISKGALPEERLDRVFDRWWPELEASLLTILKSSQDIEPARSDEDMTKEMLEMIRDQYKILSKMLETRMQYSDFIIESSQNKVDVIRISPRAAFNREFMKKYTNYESWNDAVKDIKKHLGDETDPFTFALSDWPETLISNIGFADWPQLGHAAIAEWSLKNVRIQARLW